MRSHLLIALGFAAIPALVTPAHATSPADPDTLTAVSEIFRTVPPFDTVRVKSLVARADEANYLGKLGEARRLYREAIDAHLDSNQPASHLLWRLATANLYADDKRGAASALDEMAEVAARFGDPLSELRGTFESAILYSHLKRHDVVKLRMERVAELLQSPFISDDEKEHVRSRIKGA